MKRKKPSITGLKKKLDIIYSLLIRRSDADGNGIATCVTCGKKAHYSEMHCGHYIPRRHMNTRWMRENTHVQCPRCNMFDNGNMDQYALYLIREYGIGILDKLDQEKKRVKKWKPDEIEELIRHYQSLSKGGE